MKWYKHESKSHTDEKIRDLIFKFGQEGYGIYHTCLELISEKIDKNQVPKISISDRVLREICRVSHQKLTKILSFFDQNSLIFSNFHSEYWNLDCPNLLKRLDNWTSNLQVTPKQPSNQQEQEVKKEKKKENISTAVAVQRPSQDIVSEYFKSLGSDNGEASHFYDHFQSNGWKVGGKTPMKDWKAACRNWLRSPYRKQNENLTKAQTRTLQGLQRFKEKHQNEESDAPKGNSAVSGILSGN
jgi:hypothetical protein